MSIELFMKSIYKSSEGEEKSSIKELVGQQPTVVGGGGVWGHAPSAIMTCFVLLT